MGNANFKPIFKADYSSQGALVNEVFPLEVTEILTAVKLMENKDPNGVQLALSWLAANLPPYQKFFKDYTALMATLEECRTLRDDWVQVNQKKDFPLKLRNKLYKLYEAWWLGYNDSGAGIRGNVWESRDALTKRAVQSV